MEPDDVVIADIGDQALDIFLHGAESTDKNGIGKTFTHTSIPMHPCTHIKKEEKKRKKNQQNPQLTRHDAFIYWSPSCAVCCWSTFRKLGTCATSEALSPRTVLTENISESAQQILHHNPAIMPFLTNSTLTNPPIHTPTATKSETLNSPNMTPSFTCPLPVQCVGGRLSGSLANALQNLSLIHI